MTPRLSKLARGATTVSLVLCVAMAALWVRSCWVADVVGVARNPHIAATPNSPITTTSGAVSHTLWSAEGYISLRHWEAPPGSEAKFPSDGWLYEHQSARVAANSFYLRRPGFLGVTRFDYTWPTRGAPFDGVRERVLLVPHWLVMAVFGMLPIAGVIRRLRGRRAARIAAGLCPTCGYDRAGLAGGAMCPECGAPPPPPGSAATG